MASEVTDTSSLTSDADLTEIHAQSDLTIIHESRRTKSGFLVGFGRTAGYRPTPPRLKTKQESWIYRHEEAITRLSDGKKLWMCRLCYDTSEKGLVIAQADPSTIAARHLEKEHHYDRRTHELISTGSKKRPAVSILFERAEKVQKTVFDETRYRGLYTSWAVLDNLSFRQATSLNIRNLLLERDPLLEEFLPKSHHTMATWIRAYYPLCKDEVASQLAAARSRITLSFDGWTSQSQMDVLGVVGHFIDVNYTHRTVLLGLTATGGSHTGENMAASLEQLIIDFRLGSSIGFFIADSASNNDKAVELLSRNFQVNVDRQRLRCAAHIINLVCQAILLGTDTDCVKDALAESYDEDAVIEQFNKEVTSEQTALIAWRKKGPVGKLHNLVVHVKGSPARRRYFESKQKKVDEQLPVYKLVTNGGIRWNSTHDMIARALKLKDALELYQSAYRYDKQHPTAQDELTSNDWLELKELRDLLQPMKESSTSIQADPTDGCTGALHQSLSAIDYLMSHLERQKQLLLHQDDNHFKACVNLGWKKLNKYYTLSDKTYAYRAAIYLNPTLKRQWFVDKWSNTHPQWIRDVDDLMEEQLGVYQRLHPHAQAASKRRCSNSMEMSNFERYNLVTSALSGSELELYKREPVLQGKGNIIHWWRDNKERYPVLYHMAMDLLAAPATTAADERVFSQGDDIVNNERPRLSEEMAEQQVCLRSWIAGGMVSLTDISVRVNKEDQVRRYTLLHLVLKPADNTLPKRERINQSRPANPSIHQSNCPSEHQQSINWPVIGLIDGCPPWIDSATTFP
jgi:hypothetical protein